VPRKYELPQFLVPFTNHKAYDRWLHRRALAQVRRDRKRGNREATNEKYKLAIHGAVLRSAGRDGYTGEALDWSLLSQYNNLESKAGQRRYKARFALLPTVDHLDEGLGEPKFKLCAWRTNDAKSDLSHEQFIELCRKVVETRRGGKLAVEP
jgi:hypothetical protein